MDTNYNKITVTNTIPSGAAFAIKHGTGESCYIPASLAFTTKVHPGDIVDAILIENPNEDVKHRTPYMVRFIKPDAARTESAAPPVPAPVKMEFDAAGCTATVRARMREGGVWTVASMFADYMDDPTAKRADHPQAYLTVSNTLRSMFNNEECAKWSMWAKASQTKPSREWFSCYPDTVDVDEWAEEV